MDRAVVLLLGQAFDALVGEPEALWRRLPHPVVLAGRLVGWLDRRWNLDGDPPTRRRDRGVAALAVVLIAAAAAGAVLAGTFGRLGLLGGLLEAGVVGVLLAQRSLHDHVTAVADAFLRDGLSGARHAVSAIVGRDPGTLDEAGVCRAAIESTAENFSDGVVAPAFWYLIAGLPGLLAYKALNTADSMIGHRSDRHRHFGWAAARLDDLANWVPARLSALLVVAAAWTLPDGEPAAAWRAARRDADRHRSVNAGWPEAAFAGALGLRLAGPRVYDGSMVEDAWMGDGRSAATPEDIRRSLALFRRACLGLAVLAVLLAFGS
ncbi:cobalamin biosynthesis protein CobD [Thalassobaculum fulvum]|uniref:Cobalamin biosynthesis protein CobD n=1 Tax=Thalassobaculum fulvum TaxID=1633335 RepID=A0A919CR14_9PROT|nr:adenosylcobinamide-phosphate synthase CbiB [Thalassobaculum fulvum]GHD56882.1 cobalamin biosynthesis protein CobD [Thalassobaculum fulvum]